MKGLDALEKLTNYKCSCMSEKIACKEIIEQALTDYEKQKQILEVLKKKKVDIFLVGIMDCVEEYNDLISGNRQKYALTETEFDLIKEWLK